MIDYGAVSPGWMGWEGARRERDGYLEVGDDFMFVMDINVESTLRPTDRLVCRPPLYIYSAPHPHSPSLAPPLPSLPPLPHNSPKTGKRTASRARSLALVFRQ